MHRLQLGPPGPCAAPGVAASSIAQHRGSGGHDATHREGQGNWGSSGNTRELTLPVSVVWTRGEMSVSLHGNDLQWACKAVQRQGTKVAALRCATAPLTVRWRRGLKAAPGGSHN